MNVSLQKTFAQLSASDTCHWQCLCFGCFTQVSPESQKENDLASFQIANGEERRHVMCVGATRRSDSNTEPLGSEASALTNCASCPLPQVPCHGMHWTACINTLPEVIWLCSPLAAGSVRQVFHPGQHKASAKPDLTIGLRAPRLPKSRRSALRHRSAATCSAL